MIIVNKGNKYFKNFSNFYDPVNKYFINLSSFYELEKYCEIT